MAACFFSNDAKELVLKPVENMIATVDKFRKDPLQARRLADKKLRTEIIKQQHNIPARQELVQQHVASDQMLQILER
jgi:hypothetical protein